MRRIAMAFVVAALLVLPLAPSAHAATVPVCKAAWLSARSGGSGGAAGTIYWTLVIVNRSNNRCSLSGTPTAQPVRSVGSPTAVGPAAERFTMSGRGGTVILKPRASASVVLGVGQAVNYPTARCLPKRADAIRLTFRSGATRVRLLVPLRNTLVCTKLASTRIAGIAAGTHTA